MKNNLKQVNDKDTGDKTLPIFINDKFDVAYTTDASKKLKTLTITDGNQTNYCSIDFSANSPSIYVPTNSYTKDAKFGTATLGTTQSNAAAVGISTFNFSVSGNYKISGCNPNIAYMYMTDQCTLTFDLTTGIILLTVWALNVGYRVAIAMCLSENTPVIATCQGAQITNFIPPVPNAPINTVTFKSRNVTNFNAYPYTN